MRSSLPLVPPVSRTPVSRTDEQGIADNLARIQDSIARAAARAGRSPDSITLMAVSKTQPEALVLAALMAGQIHFGENRVQEARPKYGSLRVLYPAIRLHLIGALQTNKTRDALICMDSIDTLDRPRLLDSVTACLPPCSAHRFLVQVNVDDEPQKAGIPRDQADSFITLCRARLGAALAGLMVIPAQGRDPARAFAWLAECAARHGLSVLSMGMSADYETAIQYGATEIRIGSALFGNRSRA